MTAKNPQPCVDDSSTEYFLAPPGRGQASRDPVYVLG